MHTVTNQKARKGYAMSSVNFSCHDVLSVELSPVAVKTGYGSPYAVRTLRVNTGSGKVDLVLFSRCVNDGDDESSAKFLEVSSSSLEEGFM